LECRLERDQGTGIHNDTGLQSRASCQIDGVLHERQVPRLVAVRRKHEPDAVLFPSRRERVRQVHALGVAVQLEQTPRHRAAATQRVEIEGVWLTRSEEHTSELQSRGHLVCRLLLEKKKR